MTIGPGDSQEAIDIRKAASTAEQLQIENDKAAHRLANPDEKPVTWRDLRELGLVDD